MKKVYMSMLMTFGATALFAQTADQLPDKNFQTAKYAPRTVENNSRGGGGLSCPTMEGFNSGFPSTWTNSMTNNNQNWTYMATGGNPNGHMDIQYDDALGLQDESLITDSIDLSIIPNPGLYFDWFMSYFWGVSPNDNYDLIVSISTDGGNNFTDLWTEADAGEFDSYAWYTKVVDLSAYSSETGAIFKFTYYGTDGAQAKFDNINVCTQPDNDLRLDVVYTSDVNNDYVYTRIPVSQAVEVVAGAVASNFGIVTQTNLTYDWEVTLDGNSVASGTANGVASLAPGGVDTVWVNTGYTPNTEGELVVSFEVGSDQAEEVPADNAMSESLLVTDYHWGHDYENEEYFGFGYAGDDPDGSGGFEVGARYFCRVDGDFIYALDFPLSSTTTSTAVTVKVYEDETTNGAVSETIYDVQSGDLSSNGNPDFITVVLDDPVEMIAGSVYTATVAFEAGDDGYIYGNDVDDNDAAQAVYFINDDTWYNWVGLTTAMRLNLDASIGIEENEDVTGLYIYPNPANEVLTVGFTGKQDADLTVSILSLDGKLVASQQQISKAGQNNVLRFDVDDLSSGVYLLQIQGATTAMTQKVVIR